MRARMAHTTTGPAPFVRILSMRASFVPTVLCAVIVATLSLSIRSATYLSLGSDAAARHRELYRLASDSSEYYYTALKYSRIGRIERPYASLPETRRPVGYSLLLGWLLRIFPATRTVSVVLASVLGTLASVLVYGILTTTIENRRPALTCASCMLANALPLNIALSVSGTMEPFFSLLFFGGVAAAIKIALTDGSATPRWVPLAGAVCLSLAVWTRGNALLLPAGVLAFSLYLKSQGRPWWRHVAVLLMLPLIASLGIQALVMRQSAGRYGLPTIGIDTAAHYVGTAALGWARTGSLSQGDIIGAEVGEEYQRRYLFGLESDDQLLQEAKSDAWEGIRGAPLHVLGKYLVNWGQVSFVGEFSSSKWERYFSSNGVLLTLSLFGICLICRLPGAQIIGLFWLTVSAGAACTSSQRYRVFAHSELLLAYAWAAMPLLWEHRRSYLRIVGKTAVLVVPAVVASMLPGQWETWTWALSNLVWRLLFCMALALIAIGTVLNFRQGRDSRPPGRDPARLASAPPARAERQAG